MCTKRGARNCGVLGSCSPAFYGDAECIALPARVRKNWCETEPLKAREQDDECTGTLIFGTKEEVRNEQTATNCS